MRWLMEHETADDRSFGILPDWSSIGPVQDISAVGPLAPAEFLEFIRLIADEPTAVEYSKTTHFMLSGPWSYNLAQYPRARPVLDWLGVRYLVLNRQYFGGNARRDAAPLTEPPLGLREVYEDRRAYILTSPEAQFAGRALVWLRRRRRPGCHPGPAQARPRRDPPGRRASRSSQLPADLPPPAAQPARTAVPIASYRPNAVDLSVNAEAGRPARPEGHLHARLVGHARRPARFRSCGSTGWCAASSSRRPGSTPCGSPIARPRSSTALYLSLATAALLATLALGAAVRRKSGRDACRSDPKR